MKHYKHSLLALLALSSIPLTGFAQTEVPLSAQVKRAEHVFNRIKPESIALSLTHRAKGGEDVASQQKQLQQLNNQRQAIARQMAPLTDSVAFVKQVAELEALEKQIALSNPSLDFDQILVANYHLGEKARKAMAPALGTAPNNWSSLLSSRRKGYDAALVVLSDLDGALKKDTIYKPGHDAPLSDIRLNWNADAVLFSSTDTTGKWNVYEYNLNTNTHKKAIDSEEADLEFCDANYLPDGKLIATTNIGYNGVPCVHGSDMVANLISYDPQSKGLRRLTFDQDGNWNPVLLPNGRIMYTRWEYTDLTHYFSRIVMHMNPDGTENKALYGSGSYFPNSIFDVQPISKFGSKFVGIISGHHGVARSGRMIVFDPSKSRKEEQGMLQEIPFRDRKIVPEIKDGLVDGVWPQFIKPFPLNENYFLVAAKPYADALWGIYLVDVFDNMTCIAEYEGEGLIAPIPLQKTVTPPVIPDKIKPDDKEATVFIQDIYEGEGSRGIPRGAIKSVRIFAYEYAYVQSPSDHDAQGIQSGWDIKRVLGTVPVEADGSVMFKIPANTPVSIQPLDSAGAALQWMRSWIAGMPGEIVSCVGCHEDQNQIPIPKRTMAALKEAQPLTAPAGGVRPFTFNLEVQPILDRACVSCHDGTNQAMDLRKGNEVDYKRGNYTKIHRVYEQSYLNLHPYVYRQGPEADMYVLKPGEYHVDNSELIRILKAGHHGVKLADADWQTLYQWIDLNAPYFGAFMQMSQFKNNDQYERRRELGRKYSNVDVDWRKELEAYADYMKTQQLAGLERETSSSKNGKTPKVKGFPVSEEQMATLQKGQQTKTIEVAPGIAVDLVWVPAGKFVMGSSHETASSPLRKATVEKGFWMSKTEITNEQYRAIFPQHDSRIIGQFWKDHTTPGYWINGKTQPVVRVSWDEANAFCDALSKNLNATVALPTETQWEWAARGGNDTDFWFGEKGASFARFENLADTSLTDFAVQGVDPRPMKPTEPMRAFWDFIPKVPTENDGAMIVADVASYEPNNWGLHDMLGNVAEWTRSAKSAYPKMEEEKDGAYKVVRGGSWRDRPAFATASYRKFYKSWMAPFNVGFRIIIEE